MDLDPTLADLFTDSNRDESGNQQTSASHHKALQDSISVPASVPAPTVFGKSNLITLDSSLPFFFPCPENPAKNAADVLDSKLKEKFYRTETS